MPNPLKLLLSVCLLLMIGFSAHAGMDQNAKGHGLYGDQWRPDPINEYWDPGTYHKPERETVEGQFDGDECVECHEALTPGIVKDWRQSRHSSPDSGDPVTCDQCHGNDHQKLHFPTPSDCSTCHERQHSEFQDERRYGFPSHALAMERAVDSKHLSTNPRPR